MKKCINCNRFLACEKASEEIQECEEYGRRKTNDTVN